MCIRAIGFRSFSTMPFIYTIRTLYALCICFSIVGICKHALVDKYHLFSIPTCVQDLPMFLPNFQSLASFLRLGGCLQRTLHGWTDGYVNIDLEFEAGQEYIYFAWSLRFFSSQKACFSRTSVMGTKTRELFPRVQLNLLKIENKRILPLTSVLLIILSL